MKYLITGAGGFIGGYLTEYLVGKNNTVCTIDVQSSSVISELNNRIQMVIGSIIDDELVVGVIKDFKPDIIFHLAAQSLPKVSWENPILTMQVNILGSLNILEAIRKYKPDTRMIIFGSSSEYTQNHSGEPISEEDPTEPASPYAVSKLAIDRLSYLYSQTYSVDTLSVRPFFVIGPRKENDVCSDFAKRIVALRYNNKSIIKVGNLNAVRDFIDVRDAVSAIVRVSEEGNSGESYNICSGKGHALSEILDVYQLMINKPFNVETDPELFRPLDEKIKIGNPEKILNIGWRQKYTFSDSLESIFKYWLNN
ncbi:MAG: GDP-mannose 4,6-dehydratase [Bacteroidetes bacterium]|nr:GDP-mannose 4,6-dehydratase [Bacteroidota bacterium]